MARRSTIIERIEELAAEHLPLIEEAFLDAVRKIISSAEVGRIAELLEKGDVEGAIRAVHLDEAAYRELEESIRAAYIDGGDATVERFPPMRAPDGGKLVVRFDVRAPQAETWLTEHSSQLVTRTVEDQRDAVRSALTAGMEAGQNPRQVALDIVGRVNRATQRREGGIIGLTAQQEQFVRNARAELLSGDPSRMAEYLGRARRDARFDRAVRKAIAQSKPLDGVTVNRIVGRYADRLLELRGEMIARTEMLAALNMSQRQAFEQAIASGAITRAQVRKIWRSAGDSRVRDSHVVLNRREIGMDEAFRSPSGAAMLHPGDTSMGAGPSDVVGCRCNAEYKVDFLTGIR